MLCKVLVSSCLSLLMINLPGSPAAVGQLTTSGTAQVNGVAAAAQTTIFAGDRITTELNTHALLAMPGGDQVLLPASSTAAFARNQTGLTVSLEHGAVTVANKSEAPVFVAANGARIHTSINGLYAVSVNGASVTVMARRGTAVVETAKRTVEVPEGNTLEATTPPPQAGAAGLSGLQTFAIVASVAAGVTGLALGAAALSNQPPNPKDCTVTSASTITCP
jgi:ferric-dicitrate binding protein FerR (iron transport regulator)